MSYDVKILAHSIAAGVPLITVQATYPRIIHSELMTHRVFSRNAASSRAIPVEKSIERVLKDPFIPEAFAKNVRGMQAGEALDDAAAAEAREIWLRACSDAAHRAGQLARLGVHKHWANRLLEPYSWITTVITATEWANFFALRCHPAAAPEFQKIAGMIYEAIRQDDPVELAPGEWHLPFVDPVIFDAYGEPDENKERKLPIETQVKLSVARCARVSYLTHDGKRDIEADLALYTKLVDASPRHLSPASTPCASRPSSTPRCARRPRTKASSTPLTSSAICGGPGFSTARISRERRCSVGKVVNTGEVLPFGASAMDVACPFCKAEIGVECAPTNGVTIKGQPHPARANLSPEYLAYTYRRTGVVTEAEALESKARRIYETRAGASEPPVVLWESLSDEQRPPWPARAKEPPVVPPFVPTADMEAALERAHRALTEKALTEKVDHPNHYGGDTTYETIKVLEAWLSPAEFIGFCRGNAIKYQSRAGKKQGESAEQDLKKARW